MIGGEPVECSAPADVARLYVALDEADASWGRDVESFARAVTIVHETLPCLIVPLTAEVAARVHRLDGLAAFADKDADRSMRAFASARVLDPDYQFPPEMVPAGNPVLIEYTAFPTEARLRRLPIPKAGGRTIVDGTLATGVPSTRPALLQVVDRDGVARATSLVLPGDPLPEYPVRGAGLRVPLLIGTGAILAGGVTSWLLALDAHDEFESRADTPEGVEGAAGRANTLGGVAIGLGAGAVVCGTLSWVVAEW